MRINWFATLAISVLYLWSELYFNSKLRRGGRYRLAAMNTVVIIIVAILLGLFTCLPLQKASFPNSLFVLGQYALYTFITIVVSKILAMAAHFISNCLGIRRPGYVALIVAAIAFGVMWWGAIVTPGKIEVKEVVLAFERLPDAFDGYRIVQWSDAHLGTYNGRTSIVERQIQTINDLHPDMICFTGDLVNRKTDEALPYRDLLASLHAPDGVYSVLGNHDYDNYVRWDHEQDKMADRKALCDLQEEAGWRLLNDDYTLIKRGDDQIVIIGTENYGERPFDKRGNLARAYGGLNDSHFKIQLQHNPYAWRASTLTNSNIDLMLSGHTHAWQILLKFGDWQWSPASLRYPEWGGAYNEGDRWLYVNIGTGMVGTPMRIGATPEITVITLKKSP